MYWSSTDQPELPGDGQYPEGGTGYRGPGCKFLVKVLDARLKNTDKLLVIPAQIEASKF